MNHAHEDDAIDALLRRQFEGAVADDGFCDGVMQHLPARPRGRKWPLWGGLTAGVAACWLTLSSNPMFHLGWQDWIGGERSVPAIVVLLVVAGMSLLALCWSLAELEGG